MEAWISDTWGPIEFKLIDLDELNDTHVGTHSYLLYFTEGHDCVKVCLRGAKKIKELMAFLETRARELGVTA